MAERLLPKQKVASSNLVSRSSPYTLAMAKDGKKPLKSAALDTLAVHAGEGADPTTRAHNLPIYQTATFTFETADEKESAVDAALAWEPHRYFYTRTNNPTTAALEEKLAALEGAESAVASASGMSAIAAGLLAHLKAGDHLLVADDLFIISQILFAEDFPSRGIEVTPVPITDLAAVAAAMRPNTKVVFCEGLSNPWMRITDIPAIAKIAHAGGALLEQPPSEYTYRTQFFPLDLYQRDLRRAARIRSELPPRVDLAQAALRFSITHPAVHCALIGFRSPEQIDQAAANASLGRLELEFADRLADFALSAHDIAT